MALKQKVLDVLERSRAVQSAFVAGLSDEQRSAAGTYEKWCAKDAVAHMAYLDEAEQRLAQFLASVDLMSGEEPFRWTGATLLSRMAYTLRHTQHHLAEMCLELHRRGYKAPQWQ